MALEFFFPLTGNGLLRRPYCNIVALNLPWLEVKNLVIQGEKKQNMYHIFIINTNQTKKPKPQLSLQWTQRSHT